MLKRKDLPKLDESLFEVIENVKMSRITGGYNGIIGYSKYVELEKYGIVYGQEIIDLKTGCVTIEYFH